MKLLFTGDINFRGMNGMNREKARCILSGVRPYLDAADFRIPNLECPLAYRDEYAPIWKSGPNLICDPENVIFLEEMNADAVTLANNHIGDYGEGAMEDTLRLLDGHGILHAGAGRNVAEAYIPFRLSKDGVSISVLSVCEHEYGYAETNAGGSAGYDPRRLLKSIRGARQSSDYVVVVFHGGNEFNPFPSPDTVERYRLICDMGADAVIAGHTHCPQGCEMYEGKPIVYSMGNFLFQSSPRKAADDSWHYGYIAMLDIGEGMSLDIIPYRFNQDASHIEVFQDEARRKMLEYIGFLCSVIQKPDDLEHYFMGWAWNHQWCPSLPKPGEQRPTFIVDNRNLINNETYTTQLRAVFQILYQKKQDEAAEWACKVVGAQKMPV